MSTLGALTPAKNQRRRRGHAGHPRAPPSTLRLNYGSVESLAYAANAGLHSLAPEERKARGGGGVEGLRAVLGVLEHRVRRKRKMQLGSAPARARITLFSQRSSSELYEYAHLLSTNTSSLRMRTQLPERGPHSFGPHAGVHFCRAAQHLGD